MAPSEQAFQIVQTFNRPSMPRPLRFLLASSVTVLGCYVALATAALTDLRLRSVLTGSAVAAVSLVLWLSRSRVGRGISRRTAFAVSSLSLSALLCLLMLDLAYGVYFNRMIRPALSPDRSRDPHLCSPELLAGLPLMDRDAVVFYKPEVRVEATIHGNLTVPAQQGTEDLLSDVVEPRRVSYQTGAHGLRDSASVDAAELVALGDSFTFGDGIDNSETWVTQIQEFTHRETLNAGFCGSSPQDEVARLEWLLKHHALKPGHVIWLLFEGNDLTEERLLVATPPIMGTLDETLPGAFLNGMEFIRRYSILARACRGTMTVHDVHPAEANTHQLSNGALLLDCGAVGKKLFSPADIAAAGMSRDQIRAHQGMLRLQTCFQKMRVLADRHQFEVLVAVAPTDARVYAGTCPALVGISEDSPLEAEVQGLAMRHEFQFVPLVSASVQAGRTAMLYFRDDTHWNATGHAVTARILSAALMK